MNEIQTFIENNFIYVSIAAIVSVAMFVGYMSKLTLFKVGDVIVPDYLERWEATDRNMKILEVGKENYLVEYVGGPFNGSKTTVSFNSQHNYSKVD